MSQPQEAPPQETKIPTPKIEPVFSTLVPFKNERLFFPPATPPTATAPELLAAITFLASQALADNSTVREGEDGDAFLVYDFSFRVHGEKPMRLQGMQTLHGLLCDEGLLTAPGEVEATLHRIWTPIKNKLVQLINRRNEYLKPATTGVGSQLRLPR